MSPAADTRSRTGGANYDEPADTAAKCSAITDRSPRAKGATLRRFKKEEGVIYHIPSSSDLASLFALDESNPPLVNPPTLNKKFSSPSIDTIRPLRAVRRLLRTSETVAPPKTTYEHAVKSSTSSPTKSPSNKSGSRKLRRSASSRVEDGAETDIASITSRILQRLTILQVPFDLDNVREQVPISQTTVDATPLNPTVEDLNMKVRCHERHVTIWDAPDCAFFIFPAQLLIACTSKNDFDPLAIPDVTIVDLVCTTVAINGPYKSHPQIAFRTFYDGATICYVKDEPTLDLSRGIHIGNVPWCSTMDGDGNFGWYMRFWIPIPFALFQRAETRTFKIDVKVHVNGEDGKGGFLNASSEFTLSRLRRGLAM
ncbi:uncharacterized protein BJ212DRAFT_858397 [Suillus subaureus]|uniref:Uncharacterized protein n=1 Tax=Suillus subaureus TaxID=48587 RepID=A0A9P7J6U1_9AGAM|nr:uncharacterized protein BJ212DRAFT_858397 [Suillus subaureus]KAG1805551.1 hypothetical protein BJ212DRAFT_858397 [Suillus subaureus]